MNPALMEALSTVAAVAVMAVAKAIERRFDVKHEDVKAVVDDTSKEG